jgi:hypothetical protein
MIRWSGPRRSRAVITLQVSASKQRFFAKKRAKNFIPWSPDERPRLQGIKSFFASFCSQKEDLP